MIRYRPVIGIATTVLVGTVALSSLAYARRRQMEPTVKAIAAVFAPFAPKVKTHTDNRTFSVESDGMPDHPLMVGITSWQQQVPIPQNYTGSNAWQFPIKPVPARQPLSAKTHFFRGAIAIAANGVPIFNALNNRGDDAFLAGELDQYGGHAGRADDYHYHIAPLYLEKIVGKGKPVAYALDGYPLYGLTDPDGKEPGKLDEFNGHSTTTLGYHYHATKTYPYINGGFHGEVIEREGQVDPQPRAQPIRPGTPPLRGATITEFSRPRPGSYSLTYTIQGQTCKINYRLEKDSSYTFDYVAPDGATQTRSYHPQPHGPGGEGKPPRPDGPEDERRPPRPDGSGPDEQSERRPRPPEGDRRESERGHLEPPTPQIVTPLPTDFQLTSPAVNNSGALPKDFSCDGSNVSLPVAWKNVPAGTRSFALIMHHIPPDNESPHVYWIVYNLPSIARAIAQNDNQIGKRGINTINRRPEYAPPCSKGPGKKWYTLTLYALSSAVDFAPNSRVDRDMLLTAIKDRTLKSAVLQVSYTRE